MPGRFWKCILGTVLCSVILGHLVGEPKANVKTSTSCLKNATPKNSAEGFFPFGKECSIVTSIIARVYTNGKFVGILFVDRGRPPLGPALPGGIVRYKENPEDCVKRTLHDECGVNSVSNLQQFKVYSEPQRDPRMHAVDITYCARIDDPQFSSGTDAKQTWVFPLDKIPWTKLVFDHKNTVLDYLQHLISCNDNATGSEKIQLANKHGARNKNDFEAIAQQAYRPPHLFVAGFVEVYKNNEFKGIALMDSPSEKNIKLLPGGRVVYEETIEQSFQRHLKEKCHTQSEILCQFKSYSYLNFSGKKHDITTVLLARIEEKDLGSLKVYSLDALPETFGFHHREILEDYLKYRNGESSATCSICIPIKALNSALH